MAEGEPTTGQKLLASLHGSHAVRQERYASTVQAKMAEVRDLLNSQGLVPKHAVRADLAIFGDATSEVHRLLPEAPEEQVCCMLASCCALRQHCAATVPSCLVARQAQPSAMITQTQQLCNPSMPAASYPILCVAPAAWPWRHHLHAGAQGDQA